MGGHHRGSLLDLSNARLDPLGPPHGAEQLGDPFPVAGL